MQMHYLVNLEQYKVNSKKYQTYLGELALEGKIEVEDNTIIVL